MSVDERLDRLERKNHRLQVMLALIFAVGAGGLLVGQATRQAIPDLVKARAFHVVGEDGKVLVALEQVHGSEGVVGGGVTTLNSRGEQAVRLGVTMEGQGIIAAMDGKGRALVRAGPSLTGVKGVDGMVDTGIVAILSSEGQQLVQVGATDDGGMVTAMNRTSQHVVQLGASMDGTGIAILMDPSGVERRGVLTTSP